ncbi:MAG: type II toxin-antitoxin system RelE/ParE family toxin [Lachnospiraceae bacterium]|nr:type II toxin-antitoxin system RelE/ParE family toxin [Lachnospiraceae bacterium]
MTRTFIETSQFTKNWERLGFTDDDMRRLELEIMKNPKVGTVIRGTGKLRKMRFAMKNEGKSGSVRICYVDYTVMETVYLITVYPKSEKDNLSKEECNNIKKLIDILERSLQKQRGVYYE